MSLLRGRRSRVPNPRLSSNRSHALTWAFPRHEQFSEAMWLLGICFWGGVPEEIGEGGMAWMAPASSGAPFASGASNTAARTETELRSDLDGCLGYFSQTSNSVRPLRALPVWVNTTRIFGEVTLSKVALFFALPFGFSGDFFRPLTSTHRSPDRYWTL